MNCPKCHKEMSWWETWIAGCNNCNIRKSIFGKWKVLERQYPLHDYAWNSRVVWVDYKPKGDSK